MEIDQNAAADKTQVVLEGRELVLTRHFEMPRELLFTAWTDPQQLARWWGPEGFTLTIASHEATVGGSWKFIMHGPDGTDYPNTIVFAAVEAPERLQYSHGDDQGEHFKVSIHFEATEGNQTLLTMRMQFPSVEALQQAIEQDHALEGAQSTLQRLAVQLPQVTHTAVKERAFVVERIFDAPRALVFKAFSEAEHLKHWWGPRGWQLTHCAIDFRPGGSWHYCMKCEDRSQGDFYGFEAWGKGVYQEIVEGEKIVYLDYFSDAQGNENPDLPATETTLLFEDYHGKTRVWNESRYATAEGLKTVIDMGMAQGITETWDRLAEHLVKAQQKD